MRDVFVIVALVSMLCMLGACQGEPGASRPKHCAWAPESPTPTERWNPVTQGRAHSFLSHHGGFDVSELSEIEGCALPIFMSSMIVIRFRAAGDPSLASWTGTPTPARAQRELGWLREHLFGLGLPSAVTPLGLEQREHSGNVDELSLYRYDDEGPTYLFVFNHAG
ncbi:hypothetical protein [Enhygromyxa salina]|uniref:Lipoprotein n=1 Tax=Enhygromyxa salina TaxID=215803 RepID=A0A2S9XU71_9BACT|nr:hypothetical protein [Enhygromyxa salina]PRP96427.1 hypothetical protein ENSA7_72420 [Enhygromyxa salina]